jgi:hypothetical protein
MNSLSIPRQFGKRKKVGIFSGAVGAWIADGRSAAAILTYHADWMSERISCGLRLVAPTRDATQQRQVSLARIARSSFPGLDEKEDVLLVL